ncbi:MAG TPA: hypothetical protein VFR51_00055 [Pyrinomonadaceae bacterium]|nr:hypothetical protein [Pyrinomonadaceae bacterium]
MSLLEDLQSLDITEIINARSLITNSVSSQQIRDIVGNGAAASALGSFGGDLLSVQNAFPNPESLLRPVVQAVEGLVPHFDVQGLPLPAFTEAVREGAAIAGRIVSMVSGSPANFGEIFGTSLGQAMEVVTAKSGEAGRALASGATGVGELFRLVDQNANLRDPRAVAELAAEILLPFPKTSLIGLRDGVGLVISASEEVSLPTGRLSGLLSALDGVSAAADAGDAAALEVSIRRLREARTQTLTTLQNDLRFAIEQIDRLRIPQLLNPLVQFSDTLQLGTQGAIDFLDEFRLMLRDTRGHIENFDLQQVRTVLRMFPDMVEANARELIEIPIDQAVERAKEEVRKLLAHLPIRELRQQLTQFLHNAALEIQNANLDGPAEAARNALTSVANTINSADLAGQVQQAMQEVNRVLSETLSNIVGPLNTIITEVNNLAAEAEAILDRLAAGLAEFQTAINSLQSAIDGLGIEQVETQIIEALQQLRQTAEDLLSNVSLPEPLRPQVEQLVQLLQGIDFNALMQPARDVAAQLRIPDDVSRTIEDGLQRAKEVIENLLPQQLIDSISAEVENALNVIRNFNPASLVPGVSEFLNQAADAVERLDPRHIAQEISGPFQAVLDLIDRAHPRVLLAPVIDAYNSALGHLPVPDAETTSDALLQTVDSTGTAAGRSMLAPVSQLDPQSQAEVADPAQRTPTPTLPPNRSDIHAGDAIRLLGYLPGKLREILAGLEAGPAGEALRHIDALSGGLARQLRSVQAALFDIQRRLDASVEEMLFLLGPAQLRTQFALNSNFAGHASFQASLDVVATVSPSAMRAELQDTWNAARAAARQAAAHSGGSVAASIENAATALESSPLTSLVTDLDRLLAALDPEPLAVEMDAIVDRILEVAPQLMQDLLPDVRALTQRLKALINLFNPGTQVRKFLVVLDVLREELDLLNPTRLADELAEIHGVIRGIVAAYDPRILADELFAIVTAVADRLRTLTPEALLGDLTFLDETMAALAQANPATRLQGIGASLTEVGERLGQINVDALIESVNHLAPRLEAVFEHTVDAIRNEIVALLQSLHFATASASASGSVSA